MAKRVFFSFHYEDVADFRANVVRQHWMTKPDREDAGFFDHSLWEDAKRRGNDALVKLIEDGLNGTSVTCVLIGSRTYERPWVRYEILRSFHRGNRLVGVHINGIRGKDRMTKPLGPNPFSFVGVGYSTDGRVGQFRQWTGGAWTPYPRTFSCDVGSSHRGNWFSLSQWVPTYDWVSHNGFANFATWIGS